MPKVSAARDANMSLNGFVRASIVAKLFNVSTSTVGKWPAGKVPRINSGGLCWIKWEDARKFRVEEAEAGKLPMTAQEVLSLVNTVAVAL